MREAFEIQPACCPVANLDRVAAAQARRVRSLLSVEPFELPALAAIFGAKKSEVDVDAAAMELMRLAGISPGGKVRLRGRGSRIRQIHPGCNIRPRQRRGRGMAIAAASRP